MNEVYAALLQLQELDDQIARAEVRLAEFAPRLQELLAATAALDRDVENTRARLTELRQQAQKLEQGAENKREKLRLYQEKLERVRNLRDEAAARTEMDLIRRAVESEVADAQETNEQVRRTDMKVDELLKSLAKARAEIEPSVQQLQSEKTEAETELRLLRDRRANAALHIDKNAVRLYERVRGGKARRALAPLTRDGACGNCFNVIPMQEQVEIRQRNGLRRCEACGVILYPAES